MTDVVGMGAVASIGSDVDEIFANLCAGRSGLGPLLGFDRELFNARQLFEVDNRERPGADVPGRATGLLIEAIAQAVKDAGISEDLAGIPILIGTGLRELRSIELWWRDGVPFDHRRLHFGTALRDRFGATDTHTFSNACSASLYALGFGADLLALDEADTVIVAGADTVTESMFGLADRFQPEPPDRVLPFDRRRKGTILGEGAAAVVLRRNDSGARVRRHGVLRAVAVNCDAYHATAPAQNGVAAVISSAHRRAGMKPADVDLVLLHGTGTPLNDQVEASAFAEVFGPDADGPLLTGIKSMTGHTSGSAGLMSFIVALRAMATGRIPPIAGLAEPIDEVSGLRVVTGEPMAADISVAEIHGFGFGGLNAVAIAEAAR